MEASNTSSTLACGVAYFCRFVGEVLQCISQRKVEPAHTRPKQSQVLLVTQWGGFFDPCWMAWVCVDLHLYVVCELQPYRGAGSAFGTTNTEHLKRIRSHGKELCLYIYIILWYFIYIIYIIWWYFIYYIYFQNFICLLGMQSLQSGHKAFGPPHKLRYKTFHIMLLTGKGPWIWRGLASNSVQSGGGTSKVKPPLRYKVPLWARIFLRELCVKNETETASDMFQPLPSTCSDISCLEAS